MTLYDKLLIALYFLLVIYVQARWQSRLFKANKPISHFTHGVIYLLGIGPAVWVFWPHWWQIILIGVLERLALFDYILNWVRGKPILYNGRGTTGSLIDRIENKFSVVWINIFKLALVAGFVIALIKIK